MRCFFARGFCSEFYLPKSYTLEFEVRLPFCLLRLFFFIRNIRNIYIIKVEEKDEKSFPQNTKPDQRQDFTIQELYTCIHKIT